MLNILLLLTSLIGYLEWGTDMHAFLFEVEYELIFGAMGNRETITHPFVLVPLVGQVLLLTTLFQRRPSKALTYSGMVSIGLLLSFLLFIGLMGMNVRILLSALPFNAVVVFILIYYRRLRKTNTGKESPAGIGNQ